MEYIRKKYGLLVAAVLSVLSLLMVFYAVNIFDYGTTASDDFMMDELVIAPEVDAILQNKIDLIVELMAAPVIVSAVEESNVNNQELFDYEIVALDERWRKADDGDIFIENFLTNDVASKLLYFQENNSGFSEIFVTDVIGLNVGQTNKTTDYYQADEDWWIDAYDSGRGRSYYGMVEFDESAQSEAISIYVPVWSSNGEVIGITKAVIDILAIKLEL